MKIQVFSFSLFFSFALISCNPDISGCTDESAANYDSAANVDDASCEYDIVAPAEYVFVDDNGNSTVSYSGQHQRLNMLSEMVTYMKSANTPGAAIEASVLLSMYANDGYAWLDTDTLGMTGSSKQLKSKTAGGDPAVTAQFEAWMAELGSASAATVSGVFDGGPGVVGVVETTGTGSGYLQSATGQEWVQLIEKGLMGACFHYNISSVYLGPDKMEVDNTNAVDPDAGKYYTTMEHHWDEAYGYFTVATNYPEEGTDRFLGKYAWKREDPLGSATKISDAFRLGRAAISEGDMDLRDVQIEVIRYELERMLGGTAIHYLNDAITDIAEDSRRNHELSEAMAFIQALVYADTPAVNQQDVDEVMNALGADFYNVTATSMAAARDLLAQKLGLTEFVGQL